MSKLLFSSSLKVIVPVVLVLAFIWYCRSVTPATGLVTTNDCKRSLVESDGYFCESDSNWMERKNVYRSQDKENMNIRPDPVYLAANWEPNFHCTYSRRIGAMGDGGKWVCDPLKLKSRSNCLVYSVGSNGDLSFEIDLKKLLPNCEIHTFDKNVYHCPNRTCVFHQILFGTGVEPNNSKSWSTVRKELNHENRIIDILKIDIEGGEYRFFPLIFESINRLWPRQILVELHPMNVTLVHEFFYLLRSKNYVIFAKETNPYAGPYFCEYGFFRMNSQFF